MNLTNCEIELMDFLWSYGEPVTSKDILEKCKNHTWADTYLRVMLRSLEKKGAIRCCGMKLFGTKYARQFESMISREEYFVQLAKDCGVNVRVFAKAAVGLVKEEKPSDREELIRELEAMIKDFKERG